MGVEVGVVQDCTTEEVTDMSRKVHPDYSLVVLPLSKSDKLRLGRALLIRNHRRYWLANATPQELFPWGETGNAYDWGEDGDDWELV